MRQVEDLGLRLGKLERRRLAKHDFHTVLVFDGLINREHPEIAQDRVAT